MDSLPKLNNLPIPTLKLLKIPANSLISTAKKSNMSHLSPATSIDPAIPLGSKHFWTKLSRRRHGQSTKVSRRNLFWKCCSDVTTLEIFENKVVIFQAFWNSRTTLLAIACSQSHIQSECIGSHQCPWLCLKPLPKNGLESKSKVKTSRFLDTHKHMLQLFSVTISENSIEIKSYTNSMF